MTVLSEVAATHPGHHRDADLSDLKARILKPVQDIDALYRNPVTHIVAAASMLSDIAHRQGENLYLTGPPIIESHGDELWLPWYCGFNPDEVTDEVIVRHIFRHGGPSVDLHVASLVPLGASLQDTFTPYVRTLEETATYLQADQDYRRGPLAVRYALRGKDTTGTFDPFAKEEL